MSLLLITCKMPNCVHSYLPRKFPHILVHCIHLSNTKKLMCIPCFKPKPLPSGKLTRHVWSSVKSTTIRILRAIQLYSPIKTIRLMQLRWHCRRVCTFHMQESLNISHAGEFVYFAYTSCISL